MKRKEVLETAIKTVCTDREGQYGSPEDNFKFIAVLWNEYLAHHNGGGKLTGSDVAIMMALLKIARITTGIHKDDNYIDLAGYAACGAELGSREVYEASESMNNKLFMKDGTPLERGVCDTDELYCADIELLLEVAPDVTQRIFEIMNHPPIDPHNKAEEDKADEQKCDESESEYETLECRADREYIKMLSITVSKLTEELERAKDELARAEKDNKDK